MTEGPTPIGQEKPVLVPTPIPVYTLDPSLDGLDADTLAAVERCVASLAGHVPSVIVAAVAWTDRHLVVELDTPLGPMLMLEVLAAQHA
jgi:hypothetical protein